MLTTIWARRLILAFAAKLGTLCKHHNTMRCYALDSGLKRESETRRHRESFVEWFIHYNSKYLSYETTGDLFVIIDQIRRTGQTSTGSRDGLFIFLQVPTGRISRSSTSCRARFPLLRTAAPSKHSIACCPLPKALKPDSTLS